MRDRHIKQAIDLIMRLQGEADWTYPIAAALAAERRAALEDAARVAEHARYHHARDERVVHECVAAIRALIPAPSDEATPTAPPGPRP